MADDVENVVAFVEDDYDRKYRQGLIDQLEIIYSYLQLFRKQQSVINTKCANYMFFTKQLALLQIMKIKEERYLMERVYRNRFADCDHLLKCDFNTQPGSKYNAREFRLHYRMSQLSFYKLWNAIKDHPIFNNLKAKRKQVSSQYLLLVLLKYLGTEGDGMSNQKARAIFPSSCGSFDKMKNRVIFQIINTLDSTSLF